MHKYIIMIITIVTMLGSAIGISRADTGERYIQNERKWIAYYANKEESTAFKDYDIIIFDRDKHPSLKNLQSRGAVIFGYASLAEAEKERADYDQVKEFMLTQEENPQWKGHYAIDVRNPQWAKYMIENIIPDIIEQGFDGVFLDTLDRAEDLERKNPKRYRGMIKAAQKLICAIRYHYPNLKIMTNRGFSILPDILQDVDYILAESILVNYDRNKGEHRFFSDSTYEQLVKKVIGFKSKAPHIKILSLDYWDMSDEDMVKTIYDKQRKEGFSPYVTSIELDKIHKEPGI